MYEAFYQLIANPFRLSPDPRFSFQHRTYRKAMTRLRHAILHEERIILITGLPGTGKTALVNDLLRTFMPGQTIVAKIISTQLTAYELLDQIAYSFNFDHEDCSKAEVLVQLELFLRQQYQNGRRSLLIVDEAQDMGEGALEELYQLANLQYKNHQLLQMILIGPEEFLETVIIPSLEQLHQRLFAVTLLEPLDAENTEAYIKHRLSRAGWMGDPLISTETYAMIQQYSHGIPRRINQICSCLFLHGSIAGKHRLCTADLRIAIEGFQQESLMSMYKEGLTEAVLWPVEQFEETYKEEQKRDLQCRHPSGYTQKPSARVIEARRHIHVREPVSIVGVEIGDNHAITRHKKLRWHLTLLVLFTVLCSHASKARSLLRDRIEKTSIPMIRDRVAPVLVLITITLAAYFGNVDSDQPVRYREALALNLAGTQRLENLATEDRELGSAHPQLHTPAPEEQASRAIRNSVGKDVSKTRVGEKIFAAPTMEIRRPSVLELATMEVTLSVSDPEIKLLRIHATTDSRVALGNELISDVFQQQSTLPSYVTQLETLSSPAAGMSNTSTSDAATGVQFQETIIGNGPWFINLASYLHKANAERFVEDLESKGVAVCLYQVTVRGEDYWRVQMCGFSTAAEANAKANLIKEKFGLKDAWVSKR